MVFAEFRLINAVSIEKVLFTSISGVVCPHNPPMVQLGGHQCTK